MLVSAAAMATRGSVSAGIAASALQLAKVPGFLDHATALRIAADATTRDDYEDVYGLVPDDIEGWIETRGREVGGEDYARASASDRYFRCQTTRSWSYQPGQRRLDGTAPLTLAEMGCLLDYLRDATGHPLGKVRLMIRRFMAGHFMGAHHEDRLGRIVTGHVPLTADWQPKRGGLLEIYDDDRPSVIVPEFNQLALFETGPCRMQAVTPVSAGQFSLLHIWAYLPPAVP